jgi:lysozyme family protein
MANFSTAYNKTAKNEGGYVNDPDDAGGETWKGIARKMHPHWNGWALVDFLKSDPHFPANLKNHEKLELEVRKFYMTNFWFKVRGDEIISQAVADSIYDSAVNMGPRTAIILSQRSMQILETGVMDDITLQNLNG